MSNWKDFEFNDPYHGEDIIKINDVVLPDDYKEFMKKYNGGEGDIGQTWFVLYPIDELQEINDAYEVQQFMPGYIIIGSNGGGEFYGIDNEGNYFNVPDIMDVNYIRFLGRDMNLLPDRINELWSTE